MRARWRRDKLSALADWERAKKNRVYPAGCTCLQVSATKGQLVYLHEDQTVESRYCVIMPKTAKIEPFFLYRSLQASMPEFLSKEQTGLNIKPEILHRLKVKWFESKAVQKYIVFEQMAYEIMMQKQAIEIEGLETIKQWYIRWTFPADDYRKKRK